MNTLVALSYIAIFFGTIGLSEGDQSACPEGINPSDTAVSDDGICYRFLQTSMNRYKAHQFCAVKNGYLAMPYSEKVTKFLTDRLQDRKYYGEAWLGLYHDESQSTWVWTDRSSTRTYRNWADGEGKKTGNNKCAYMNSYEYGLWQQENCNTNIGAFICQYSRSPVSVGKPDCPSFTCKLECTDFMKGYVKGKDGCPVCQCP